MKTLRWLLVVVALVAAYVVVGLLQMTDPAPAHPVREPSPAYVGDTPAPEVAAS